MAPNQRQRARGPATKGGARTATTLTIVGVIVLALLAITGIAALFGGANDDGSPVAATTPATSRDAGPTETPSAGETTGAPLVTSPQGSKLVTRTYSGSGNKVVKIKKPGQATDPVLLTARYRGGGNFSVFALDSSLHRSDILVNVLGKYKGTNLLDGQGQQTRTLKVQAKGPWTIKIKQVAAAKRVTTHAKGTGDDVLLYTGTSGVATLDYRGTLNFVVKYADASSGVLADEVERYRGQVPIKKGPVLIDVSADGAWTLNIAP